MEKWHIALISISIYLSFAFFIGILAGRGRSFFSLSEYAVGDRSFNLFIIIVFIVSALLLFFILKSKNKTKIYDK